MSSQLFVDDEPTRSEVVVRAVESVTRGRNHLRARAASSPDRVGRGTVAGGSVEAPEEPLHLLEPLELLL